MSGQQHFTPGKDPVPIVQEAGWAPGPVWTSGKSRPHRGSIPDLPARSRSLYRLSYPAHNSVVSVSFHFVRKLLSTACQKQTKKNLLAFLPFNLIPFRVRLSHSVACNVCWLSGSYWHFGRVADSPECYLAAVPSQYKKMFTHSSIHIIPCYIHPAVQVSFVRTYKSIDYYIWFWYCP